MSDTPDTHDDDLLALPPGTHRVAIALLLFFVVAALVTVTARDPGLTWDEAIYHGYSFRYVEWFQSLSSDSFGERAIWRTWKGGQQHPPLGKLWIALSITGLDGVVNPLAAARMGAGMLFGAAVAVLYLWCASRSRHGERAGLMAAAAFVLMPRIFAHGHFANLEMPMLLLWLLTVVAFERGIKSWRWSVACGVLFGFSLLTKINAVFLPVVLLPWGFLFHGRKAFRNTIFMAILGPALFIGGWPIMWQHPLSGPRDYLASFGQRASENAYKVPVYYLGNIYTKRFAPFHYPFVMLLATTPLLILAAAANGVKDCIERIRKSWRNSSEEVLLLWACAFPVLLLAMPFAPKYDGIRLMLLMYPFLAALAADGVCDAWDRVRARFKKPARVAWPVGALLVLWLAVPVVAFHPFQLSYYGELAGGPWGARKLGFETTYWGDTLDIQALRYLNTNVPAGGRVALVNVGDFVWPYYEALQEVRSDIRRGEFDRGNWDYLVIIPRQGMLTEAHRKFMATHEPVWARTLPPFGSPPLCLIYASP